MRGGKGDVVKLFKKPQTVRGIEENRKLEDGVAGGTVHLSDWLTAWGDQDKYLIL